MFFEAFYICYSQLTFTNWHYTSRETTIKIRWQIIHLNINKPRFHKVKHKMIIYRQFRPRALSRYHWLASLYSYLHYSNEQRRLWSHFTSLSCHFWHCSSQPQAIESPCCFLGLRKHSIHKCFLWTSRLRSISMIIIAIKSFRLMQSLLVLDINEFLHVQGS